MAYPRKARQLGPSPESNTRPPEAPTTSTPEGPAPPTATGGAPRVRRSAPRMFQPVQARDWSPATRPPGVAPRLPGVLKPMPSPFSLSEMETDFQPFVEALHDVIKERLADIAADHPRLAAGFNDYPRQMAQLIARRAIANYMEAQVDQATQGDIARWLQRLQERRRR